MSKNVTSTEPERKSGLTGLLLGAGASYDLGMPLVWELTNELKKWLTPEKLRELNRFWLNTGEEFGYPDTTIEDLCQILQRKDMHYESILGHLQVQSRRDIASLQSHHGLYSFLLGVIYALLQHRHLLNTDYIERNILYLAGIKTLARRNLPLWIFSLNYDLIIECAAAHFGIPLNSGFTEETIQLPRRNLQGAWMGDLKANILTEEVLEKKGLPFFNSGQMGINLLKIHGSLDVFAFQDGRHMLKIIPNGEGVQGVMSSLNIVNQELRYVDPNWPGGVVTASNEIVFADKLGEMQFLRRSLLSGAHKFNRRYSQVIPNELLVHFEANLNYLTNLVCIGYGFGDRHINNIIRNWLEFHGERNMVIVDPKVKQIPNMFLHIATQIELVALDCTDYLDEIGNIKRTRLETLARYFGKWKRDRGASADSTFANFHQQKKDQLNEKITNWASELPMRDGDVDLEQLGLTMEELVQKQFMQVVIPYTEEVLEEFLQKEGYIDDKGASLL